MGEKEICRNHFCKHYRQGDTCGTTMEIGADGKCQSFEKGLLYYFSLVWQALQNQNFINTLDLTGDLRIGLYCVMTAYHLGFSEMERGTWRMVGLRIDKGSPLLKAEDILAMTIDEEQAHKLIQELETDTLPFPNQKLSAKQAQPYGWLSPMGEFTEADFCEHEDAAGQIIRRKNLINDFVRWKPKRSGTCRDFLADEKGYCLIHDPTASGGYQVSHAKLLTKAQKNFLYNYFMDMGDRFKAEQFLDAGEP